MFTGFGHGIYPKRVCLRTAHQYEYASLPTAERGTEWHLIVRWPGFDIVSSELTRHCFSFRSLDHGVLYHGGGLLAPPRPLSQRCTFGCQGMKQVKHHARMQMLRGAELPKQIGQDVEKEIYPIELGAVPKGGAHPTWSTP